MRVRWLRVALENLEAEAEYIAAENALAAAEVVAAVQQSVSRLAKYPAMGRPGRVLGTRELLVPGTPDIIPYRVRGGTVQILRVFHAKRKWPPRV